VLGVFQVFGVWCWVFSRCLVLGFENF